MAVVVFVIWVLGDFVCVSYGWKVENLNAHKTCVSVAALSLHWDMTYGRKLSVLCVVCLNSLNRFVKQIEISMQNAFWKLKFAEPLFIDARIWNSRSRNESTTDYCWCPQVFSSRIERELIVLSNCDTCLSWDVIKSGIFHVSLVSLLPLLPLKFACAMFECDSQ